MGTIFKCPQNYLTFCGERKNSQWVLKKTKGNKFPKGKIFLGKNIFGKKIRNGKIFFFYGKEYFWQKHHKCSKYLKEVLGNQKTGVLESLLVQPICLCSFCVLNAVARSQPPKLVRNEAHAQAIRQG